MYVLVFILLIYFGPKYYGFSQSKYQEASGNGFFKSLFDKGVRGEYLTFEKIEKLGEYGHILTNLYLPTKNGTTEVDLVFVHATGVYVFESKNYGGWIFGNENHKDWTQVLQNKQKFKFYNPIWQNKGHIEAIKEATDLIDEAFSSYIVFSERCTLKKIEKHSPEVKVLKRENLQKVLKEEIKSTKAKFKIEEVELIALLLKKHSLASDTVKREHINKINERKS